MADPTPAEIAAACAWLERPAGRVHRVPTEWDTHPHGLRAGIIAEAKRWGWPGVAPAPVETPSIREAAEIRAAAERLLVLIPLDASLPLDTHRAIRALRAALDAPAPVEERPSLPVLDRAALVAAIWKRARAVPDSDEGAYIRATLADLANDIEAGRLPLREENRR